MHTPRWCHLFSEQVWVVLFGAHRRVGRLGQLLLALLLPPLRALLGPALPAAAAVLRVFASAGALPLLPGARHFSRNAGLPSLSCTSHEQHLLVSLINTCQYLTPPVPVGCQPEAAAGSCSCCAGSGS